MFVCSAADVVKKVKSYNFNTMYWRIFLIPCVWKLLVFVSYVFHLDKFASGDNSITNLTWHRYPTVARYTAYLHEL